MAQKDKRQCSSCGNLDMVYGRRDISREFEGTAITVPDIEGWYCTNCGELEFDTQESARSFFEQVTALQQGERARQASELRAIRKRLKLTQRQAAELFGGGTNAFSDYERGTTRPARATVMLLHLLDHHPELLQELRACNIDK
jgi:HTH-type transcriptional regulator/antitoxin MqsA